MIFVLFFFIIFLYIFISIKSIIWFCGISQKFIIKKKIIYQIYLIKDLKFFVLSLKLNSSFYSTLIKIENLINLKKNRLNFN